MREGVAANVRRGGRELGSFCSGLGCGGLGLWADGVS